MKLVLTPFLKKKMGEEGTSGIFVFIEKRVLQKTYLIGIQLYMLFFVVGTPPKVKPIIGNNG